jgi:membrane carboxypeptidase/penicillin-binding protein PbpC
MIFAMDHDLRSDYQAVVFSALAPATADTVKWILNGEQLGETIGTVHRWLWRLQGGEYRLEVIAGKECSAPVCFRVID